MKLFCYPAHSLSSLFRQGICCGAAHLRQYLAIAVAANELHRHVEAQQTRDGFTWHGAWQHITADDDPVYLGSMRGSTNVLKYSFKRREVRVNVIDCSRRHTRFFARF
jgi:hypothetical protein